MQELLDNMEIKKCRIKRNDQIKPLISMQKIYNIQWATSSIQPYNIFTRLAAVAQKEEEDIE